jgi:LysM repeat protein
MDCDETYMVQSGDSCAAISATYNLTQGQLYTNNPQVDTVGCNNIYVGEVLCVSQKTFAYPLIQLPSSSPNNVAPAPSAGTPSNIPTASASTTPAPVPTSSEEEECDDEEDEEAEYCADDDESPECVYEEDLPYCDEQ